MKCRQGLSQDPSCLSFGQPVSWDPPFWTGKNFYGEEFTILSFLGVITKYFPKRLASNDMAEVLIALVDRIGY